MESDSLLAGCSIAHNPLLLYVSRLDRSQTKKLKIDRNKMAALVSGIFWPRFLYSGRRWPGTAAIFVFRSNVCPLLLVLTLFFVPCRLLGDRSYVCLVILRSDCEIKRVESGLSAF